MSGNNQMQWITLYCLSSKYDIGYFFNILSNQYIFQKEIFPMNDKKCVMTYEDKLWNIN